MDPLSHRPPRRLTEGDGSGKDALVGQLLRQVRAPVPTSEDRERVWAAVRSRRSTSTRWLWASLPALAAGLAIAFLITPQTSTQPSPVAQLAPFTLTLASGGVRAGDDRSMAPVAAGAELPSGTRVATEPGARAHVRFFDASGLLVREGTEVALSQEAHGAVVALSRGGVVASVAKQPQGKSFAVLARDVRIEVVGTLFSVESSDAVTVRVAEGIVLVDRAGARARLTAGQCWSSRTGSIESCAAPLDAQNARALTRPSGSEGRVVLEGEADLDVTADGIGLGHPPIQWWTTALPHEVAASAHGLRIDRNFVVPPRGEVRVALALPVGVVASVPAPEPGPAPVRVARPHQPRPAPVALPDVVDQPPLALPPPPPVEPAPGSEELFNQALRLAREGRFAAAAAAFESLSQGSDSFAAQSLYELGRLRHQSLKDPKGALAAFDSYRQRFPNGMIREEVDLTAVEAALSAGEPLRARTEADAFLAVHPRSERERLVRRIRADLSREAGDCAAALRDYDRLLEEDPSGPEADDATYDAALCEARLGGAAAARARLERYLSRFPAGKHAAQAVQALGKAAD
jgi:outer membrane protein assembly factor BamD (BamD/ComL family)/protein-disulfide isomerase-like protein with CxxC motif